MPVPILRDHDQRRIIGSCYMTEQGLEMRFLPEARITERNVPAGGWRTLEHEVAEDGAVILTRILVMEFSPDPPHVEAARFGQQMPLPRPEWPE